MSATTQQRRSPAGWTGTDLMSLFLTNSVDNHTPRANTGEVYVQKEGNVCCVQKSETLPRAFRKLVQENFLAMPVLDGKRYVGMISMLDLVKHVNSMFWGDTEEDWIDYWSKSEDFAETTVGDIVEVPDQWNRDPAPTVLANMSSMYALEQMVHNKKCHRLAVIDPESNKLCSIITHSMLISFVRQIKPRWGRFADLKVRQMLPTLGTKPVITCNGSDTAINAFNKLEDNEVNGLAVVDDMGKLKGSLSIRDLRGVGTDGANFFRLFSSVNDFKRSARRENPDLAPNATHYEQARTPVSALFVTPEQSIEDVIDLMHDGNIHRVYVCASKSNPIPTHVISQSDVLAAVLQHIKELSETDEMENAGFAMDEEAEERTTGQKRARGRGGGFSGSPIQIKRTTKAPRRTSSRTSSRTINID